MSIDQVNFHTFEIPEMSGISYYKQDLIPDMIGIDCIDDIIIMSTPTPDQNYVPSLFQTNDGYCGGYIISRFENSYEVLFTRDEIGRPIHQINYIPIMCQVFPTRKNKQKVWIYTQADSTRVPMGTLSMNVGSSLNSCGIKAKGFVKVGENINIGFGIGSGINSVTELNPPSKQKLKLKRKLVKYPIYNPLTFHNYHHRNTLTYASSFISQLINEYLRSRVASLDATDFEEIMEQARWLVNVVLTIDNHMAIPKNVFSEALTNFCLDYMTLSPGTLLRQPINYVFDILGIDGVYSKEHLSVSYISTYFEGITYEC